MKIKILIIKLILSLILLSGNAIAKNLPPGSGISDVPANVLILLDKSGSMGARMTSVQVFIILTVLQLILMGMSMQDNIIHME